MLMSDALAQDSIVNEIAPNGKMRGAVIGIKVLGGLAIASEGYR
jgi:hypothetical protein